MTIGDLAYSILASFNSLAYHLYSITYKDGEYKYYIDDDLMFDDEIALDASQGLLSDIELNNNDTMEMEYDFGFTTIFKIKYLGSRELEENDKTYYPYIIDGAGNGMLDDVSKFDLKKNNIMVKKVYSLIKKDMKIYNNINKRSLKSSKCQAVLWHKLVLLRLLLLLTTKQNVLLHNDQNYILLYFS